MINIPGYKFVEVTPIEKGVSGDKKYRVDTTDGCTMLLRVSDISEYERKKTMYDIMKRVAVLGVPMSQPIDFGICGDEKSIYQLLSWCDGDTADVLLPKMSKIEQYKLGLKSGEALRLIHTIPAPDDLENWYDRFFNKNDKRVKAFHDCGIKIDGSDLMLSYYEQNKHLLHARPQCFNHGDYHCDNLMVSDSLVISVIDWDLYDDNLYGDPWAEFMRILNADVIPHFTTGLIRGYFDGEPSEDFWRLLMFYFSAGALQLVSWAVYVEPKFLDECIQTATNVLLWYNGMQNIIPTWYLQNQN
jgi:serine/threonine-protein kinase